jgi:hypothetical protein
MKRRHVFLTIVAAGLTLMLAQPAFTSAADCASAIPQEIEKRKTRETPRPPQSGATWDGIKRFENVVIIVLENQDYYRVHKHPDFSDIAKRGVSFSRFLGTHHPSYPNYLAMVGGKYFNTFHDLQRNLSTKERSIADLLEAKDLSWTAYAERYPGTATSCFTDDADESRLYQRKHVPFLSFTSITKTRERCSRIMNASGFNWKTLPNYSMVTPDMCNDGHNSTGCSGGKTQLDRAGAWLKGFLAPVFQDPTLVKDTLIVVTFDESDNIRHNHIYTVFLGGAVKQPPDNKPNGTCLDHYNVLRTIEDNFSLGTLGQKDKESSPIVGVWAK